MKKTIIFLLLIFIVNFSFLFSGPPDSIGPNSYCPHQYVRLNKYMGVPVNCDEFVFIGAAVRPAYLTEQGFQRQSRPGYIILGTIMGYSIYYVLYPFHKIIQSIANKNLSGQFSTTELQKAILYGSVYVGFILINITILFLSLLLFEKTLIIISGSWKNEQWLRWICLIPLVSNQVCKTFFWTAHQQMFTILTPLSSLYIGLLIQKGELNRRKIILFSLSGGLLLLFYGNFLLLLPSILFSYILKLKKTKRLFDVQSWITAISSVVFFLLPITLWIISLKIIGINFHSHEFSAFREFVWIKDSLLVSFNKFAIVLFSNTLNFLKTAGSLFSALLFLAVILIFSQKKRKSSETGMNKPITYSANKIFVFTLLSLITFLWLLGYYADRLTFAVAPFILFTSAIYINKTKLKLSAQYALAVLIFVLHVYTVLFNAPHFSERLFFQ